jgi:hypothetical protein
MLSRRLTKLLTAYVDGELDPQKRAAVDELLRRSLRARALLQQLQSDSALVRTLPPIALDKDLTGQILEKIERQHVYGVLRPEPIRKRFASWSQYAVAASVLIAATLLTLTYSPKGRNLSRLNGVSRGTPLELAETEPAPTIPKVRDRAETARPSMDLTPIGPALSTVAPPQPPDFPNVRVDQAPDQRLGAPVSNPEELRSPSITVPLIITARELELGQRQDALRDEFGKRRSHRVDIDCSDTAQALERVRSSLRNYDIQLIVDKEVRDRFKVPPKATVAVYLQDLKPGEMLSLLRRIIVADPKATNGHKAIPTAAGLTICELAGADHQQLRATLQIDPTEPVAASGAAPLKPLSAKTEEEVVKSLTMDREAVLATLKPGVRPAIAVPYQLNHPRLASPEVRFCIKARRALEPGALQVLIVLRPR